MDINDILNFCKTSKQLNRVCTNIFWKEIAYTKLNIKTLGKFENWAQLVLKLKYGPNDLYTIGQKYSYGVVTKKAAEDKLDDLLSNDKLYWGGGEYDNYILEDHVMDLYNDATYGSLRYEEGRIIVSLEDFTDLVYSDMEGIYYDYIQDKILYKNINEPYLIMAKPTTLETLLDNVIDKVWYEVKPDEW